MRSFPRTKKSLLPFASGVPALIWQLLFFYLPVFIFLLSSILQFSAEGHFEGLTAGRILPFFSAPYLRVIFSSFMMAFLTAAICLLIGYPLAHYIAFSVRRFKSLFLFLLIVPFWTNFLLHVYAWFFVLDRGGFVNTILLYMGILSEPLPLLNTFFSTMVMMVYYFLPFMVLPIYSSLERLDRKLLEASFDLGANSWQTFREVLLPLSLGGIRSGFFLVYIPAFGEFAIPELMGGDRHMFIGNVISQYILGDETGSMGAGFTLVSVLFLLATVIFFYILLRYITRKRGWHVH